MIQDDLTYHEPEAATPDEPSFREWAIVELFGHVKLAGLVTEVQIAGAGFLRLDIPGDGEAWFATKLLNPTSISALTPCSEATARAFAASHRPEPVSRWELPQLPGRATRDEDIEDEDVDPDEMPF